MAGATLLPCSVAPSPVSPVDRPHAVDDSRGTASTAARSPVRDGALPPLAPVPEAVVLATSILSAQSSAPSTRRRSGPSSRCPGTRALLRHGAPLLAILGLAIADAHAQAGDADARARSAAEAARAKSSSSESLLGNYLTPGLSGGQVTTVDGSRSFAPSLACQKSATMVELLVQPGPTGDITRLSIARDKDLDGSFDSHLLLPVPVSGICANGIISCAPGSWNQCRPFQWGVDPHGDLKLAAVDLATLSGCYCVNGSCGTGLVSGNLPSVLTDLGGGVIGALTTADPRIGIAQAGIEGPVIRYVGAQTTACSKSPSVTATRYRGDPAALQGDAGTASKASQVFTALTASPFAAGKAEESRRCTIIREIAVEEPAIEKVIARTSGGVATIAVDSATVRFQMGSPRDDSLKGGRCTLFEFRMSLDVKDRSRLRAVTLTRFFADDWAQVHVDGQQIASGPRPWTGPGVPARNCEEGGPFTRTPRLDLLPYLSEGTHEILLRVAVGDEGEALAEIEAIIDDSCKVEERLVDLCSGYAAANQCRLTAEQVDGVETVRQGVHTGLKPLPQTRIFGTGRCAFQYRRDFFERDRRYSCTLDSAALPSPDLSRGAYILDRSTEKLIADRTRSADGSVVESSRPFAMPARPGVRACEPICKTRAPRANTGISAEAVVAAQQNVPSGWDSFYHACQSGTVCPAGPGEEIISACGCLDDFPEAVVMMQTVRLAGADLACSATAR